MFASSTFSGKLADPTVTVPLNAADVDPPAGVVLVPAEELLEPQAASEAAAIVASAETATRERRRFVRFMRVPFDWVVLVVMTNVP
jgi:hypothetical protein